MPTVVEVQADLDQFATNLDLFDQFVNNPLTGPLVVTRGGSVKPIAMLADAIQAQITAATTAATNAATSSSAAGTFASQASGYAANALTYSTTAQAQVTIAIGAATSANTAATAANTALAGVISALTGVTLSSAILGAASRTVLAALNSGLGLPATLTETGREGIFMWSGANLSTNVTRDTQQGVYVPPTGTPSGASGAWVRKISGALHPRHFGTPMDGTTDASAGLQAFFNVMTAERWPDGYNLDGYFKIANGLTIDGGTFGADLTFSLDFGNCFIEATAPIQHIITMQDCHNAMIKGHCHVRGQGYLSGNINSWTCDVGLFFGPNSQSMMPYFYFEGLGYAGIEFADGPNSDSCHWLKVAGQQVGSGSAVASKSKTANWSGRTDSGASNSGAQFSIINVDALPSAYAQQNVANVPSKQTLVEINGQLCVVTYIDPAGGVLHVYPWINATSGNSGTLRYHYGAGIVLIGGDSSLQKFDQVDFNVGGCVMQFGALFGSSVGILHGESNGSFARYGKNFSNNFGTVKIGQGYAEGNTYRHVPIALTTYGIEVPADLGADTEAKDYDCTTSSNAGVLNAVSTGFAGFTQTGIKGGHHFRQKANPIPYFNAGAGGEIIDFNNPVTFQGQSFYNTSARTFTLVAPTATKKAKWGYDTAYITVGGSGINGAPNGNVTFAPPAGHTINGGAASASVVYTNTLFPGPVVFLIIQTTTTDWLIYPVNPKTPAVQSLTTSGTVTPTFANDQVNVTALAVNTTLANWSGTAIPAKELMIRIKDAGVSKTIAYGTKYRAVGPTLPTATVANKTLYLRVRYNSDDDKFDVIGVHQEP